MEYPEEYVHRDRKRISGHGGRAKGAGFLWRAMKCSKIDCIDGCMILNVLKKKKNIELCTSTG